MYWPDARPVVKSSSSSFWRSPAKYRTLSAFTRPQPMLLSGFTEPDTPIWPELIAIALSSAADGAKPFAGILVPVGYQPSVRYWRMSTTAPVPDGDAIDV